MLKTKVTDIGTIYTVNDVFLRMMVRYCKIIVGIWVCVKGTRDLSCLKIPIVYDIIILHRIDILMMTLWL